MSAASWFKMVTGMLVGGAGLSSYVAFQGRRPEHMSDLSAREYIAFAFMTSLLSRHDEGDMESRFMIKESFSIADSFLDECALLDAKRKQQPTDAFLETVRVQIAERIADLAERLAKGGYPGDFGCSRSGLEAYWRDEIGMCVKLEATMLHGLKYSVSHHADLRPSDAWFEEVCKWGDHWDIDPLGDAPETIYANNDLRGTA